MDFEAKVETIRAFPLFKVLPITEVRAIAFAALDEKIKAKTILIEQGEMAKAVYLVLRGSLRIYRLTKDGEEISLGVAGTGDVIGEMALVDSAPRSAFVEAITDSELLSLSGEDVIKILHVYPEITIKMMSTLCHKVRKSDLLVEEVMTKKLIERTFSALITLSKYFENGEITLSHEELASIVGATRARITEALAELVKYDKINLSHRKIIIKDVPSRTELTNY